MSMMYLMLNAMVSNGCFDKKNIGLKSTDDKIRSDDTRTGTMKEIYDFLNDKGVLGKSISRVFKDRDILYAIAIEV